MKHTFRCLVADPTPGGEVTLTDDDSHHLIRVARRRVGDDIEVIDAHGQLWTARIVDAGPPARVRVAAAPRQAPTALAVHLIVGLAEFGRLDTLVEKATELGVEAITVMSSERVRRVPDDTAFASRRARMIRVAEAAAKQSGRPTIPRIDGVAAFDEILAADPSRRRVLVDPRGAVGLGWTLDECSDPVTLIVGPDAGFASGEIEGAAETGVVIARMGDAVLRTETAAIAALVIAAQAAGTLGA